MLPKNLQYGSKVNSAPARSSRSNIQPQNGTAAYQFGDQITINIPSRANLVMVPSESYLKFKIRLRNTTGGNCAYRWDSCGAHGLIQRIRVFHGSNLIEDIDNYNLLCKMLMDLQVSTDGTLGKYNILSGTRADLQVKSSGPPTADAGSLLNCVNNGAMSAYQINSGEAIRSLGQPNGPVATNTDTQTMTYCLNLVSIIGSLCDKQYFPLFACTSAPLRVEITLVNSLQQAMLIPIVNPVTGNNGVTNLNLSEIEYVANFIELNDEAMTMINASLNNQPLQFVIPQYKNFGANLIPVGEITFPIPAKYNSLKSLFVMCRDRPSSALYYPLSCVTRNIQQYQFRIGPNVYPPKAPSTTTEMFAEVVKAIASIADLSHQPSIESTSYNLINSTIGTTIDELPVNPVQNNVISGSFYIGLDLENYASAPKDTIFAGYNSSTDDIYFVSNYPTPNDLGVGQPAVTCRYDAFAMFDCLVLFQNNTCFIRF
jgi:hypothetical protein